MDFGVFNLLQHRNRSLTAHQVISEAMDHVRLAEELGFSRVWFAEHHFSNYSLCPSPLIFCTHAAAITKKVRVGCAVLILPLHTPARLIAEIAQVDALSGGRLDVGVGSGYQHYEFERLNADISKNKEMFHEMLDIVDRGLRQPTFRYSGSEFNIPDTAINVRSAQTPRPPIWIAGADPNSHRRCARDGFIPFISGGVGSAASIKKMRDQVDACFLEEGKDPAETPLGVLRFVCVSDNKTTIERYIDGARFQRRLAQSLRHRREHMVDDYMVEEEAFPDEPSIDEIGRNLVAGSAEEVAERICDEVQLYRPSHMNIYFAVGDVPSKDVMSSMTQFQTKVVPMIEKHFGKPLAEINPTKMPSPVNLPEAAE